MCAGQSSPSGNDGGNSYVKKPQFLAATATPVRKDLASGLTTGLGTAIPTHQTASKPRGYSGNDFSSKYEAGKSLPAGNKNSSSYWQNLTSTDGGKTLHPEKATALALEHGYPHPAYRIDHKSERQKAGIKDLDPAGFNTNFYQGNSFEGTKGHPAERKSYTIPSDKQTINALPKLIMNTNLMRALFGAKPAKGTKAKTEPVKSNTAKKRNRQLDSGTQIKGSLLNNNLRYSSGTRALKTKLGA